MALYTRLSMYPMVEPCTYVVTHTSILYTREPPNNCSFHAFVVRTKLLAATITSLLYPVEID